MSAIPDPDAVTRQARRDELEIQKLQLQVEREKKDAEETDYLTRKKLRLEIRDLNKRWPWQRVQYGVIIAGVVVSTVSLFLSYLTYRKAVREERQKGLHAAVEHLQNGWPSGAVELTQYQPEGLLILVKLVAPTNETVQKAWPDGTLAALDQLHRYGELPDDQKGDLRKAMTANQRQLFDLTIAAEKHQTKQGADYDALLESISDHYCVQMSLQRVVGAPPPDWEQTKNRVRGVVGGEPRC